MNEDGVFVLEVAARPIGGLCARALRFVGSSGCRLSLEDLILQHAIGTPIDQYCLEGTASGVMMVPIPRRGIYRRVENVEDALTLPGVEEIRITAKPDQTLIPLPEGASYLGFIFVRAETAAQAEQTLRLAHGKLRVVIDRELRVKS